MTHMAVYRKSRSFAPQGFFECEAKGLMWLGQAHIAGGTRVAAVDSWTESYLDIERITSARPTAQSAYAFGQSLARMHDYGATHFGQSPDDFAGTAYFGPLQDPVVMDSGNWDNVADYFAQGRLIPMVELGIRRGILTRDDLALTHRVCDALPHILGDAIDDKPARIHGDLWSGNVMWTAHDVQGQPLDNVEAVLIDPAAHGGHREEDLSMLSLFGMSYLNDILEGYTKVHPLKKGFEKRTTLWQLYPIAGHCVFFAGGYIHQYRSMCAQLLD